MGSRRPSSLIPCMGPRPWPGVQAAQDAPESAKAHLQRLQQQLQQLGRATAGAAAQLEESRASVTESAAGVKVRGGGAGQGRQGLCHGLQNRHAGQAEQGRVVGVTSGCAVPATCTCLNGPHGLTGASGLQSWTRT